jgi:hypothetical protein
MNNYMKLAHHQNTTVATLQVWELQDPCFPLLCLRVRAGGGTGRVLCVYVCVCVCVCVCFCSNRCCMKWVLCVCVCVCVCMFAKIAVALREDYSLLSPRVPSRACW